MNEGWKLFYSDVDVTLSAQVGVRIFISPRLAYCVNDWIPLGGRVCPLNLGYRSGHCAFCRVILNAQVGTDDKTWKGVIERQGDSNINRDGCLLQFCATNGLRIINFFSAQEDLQIHLVQRFGGQRFIIDFCIVSADLLSPLVDVRVKRGSELFTDHHLVVCLLKGLNHSRTRKRFRARRAYRIKWELLANKKVRHTFASKVAFLFRELPDLIKNVETEWNLFE